MLTPRAHELSVVSALLLLTLAVLPRPVAAAEEGSPVISDETAEGSPRSDEEESRYKSTLLFANVLELVRDEYVAQDKVDYESLTYAALRGMLSSLDPHSQFLDPSNYEQMRTDTKGQFGGLGISVGLVDGVIAVNVPIEGGPGFRAGLLPGDRIIKIDGSTTKGISLNESVRLLRGAPGAPVSLVIYRPETKEFKEYTIKRELIDVPTVRNAHILPTPGDEGRKIGYLRLTQFGDHSVREFSKALKDLTDQGAEALVLDLRNNPGGLLDAAVEVAGYFLPVGTTIVSTEGRSTNKAYYRSHVVDPYLKIPLVVLINGNSASGAEIVAGALKDMNRAILVGETTFGKGSVQTVQPVDRTAETPAALRLTTARYFTPSRRMIHEVGVSPHIEAPISISQERALFLKRSLPLLKPEEREKVRKVPDSQLRRAVAVLNGLLAYEERRPRG